MKGTRTALCTLMVAALLAAAATLAFAFFFQAPFWPKLVGSFDWCHYFGPQAFYMDVCLHGGELPQWNPLTFCGVPFAANPQVSLFYPPNLIRSLLTFHPTPQKTHVGLAVMVLLHMVLAGGGTYALARRYGLSPSASFVAAFGFMFGPHFERRVLEQWILVGVAAWLPLLLLCAKGSLDAETARDRRRWIGAGGLVFGVSTLAGFPQLTFYTAIALSVFVVLHFLSSLGAVRFRKRRSWLRRVAIAMSCAGGVLVLGTSVSAVMLLPAGQYALASARAKGGGFEVEAAPQDLSKGHLVRSLVVYPGATRDEQGLRSTGIGILMLAVAGLAHKRGRSVVVFAALTYVLMDCTLGPPFPFGRLVSLIDVCQFSSPWRAGILAGLPPAMLAGFGVDALFEKDSGLGRRLAAAALAAAAGVPALLLLQHWRESDPYPVVGSVVVVVPAIALALACIAAPVPKLRTVRPFLAALVLAEIVVWNRAYLPQFVQARGYRGPEDFFKESAAFPADNRRRTDPRANMDFYGLKAVLNGYDPLYIREVRQLLCAPGNEEIYRRTLKDWETTSENYRGNLFAKRFFWLARQAVIGPLPGKDELYPVCTTAFLPDGGPESLTVPEAPRESVVGSSVSEFGEEVQIADAAQLSRMFRRGQGTDMQLVLPAIPLDGRHAALRLRYSAARSVESRKVVFRDADTERREYGKHTVLQPGVDREIEWPLPDFERVQVVMTWRSAGSNLAFREACVVRDNADEDRAIRVVSRSANAVDVELTGLAGPRLLLFVDAAFPGWRAWLDGAPVDWFPANDVFKAVFAPAGNHRVRFAYWSPWLAPGAVVSVLACLVAVAFILGFRTSGNRRLPSPIDEAPPFSEEAPSFDSSVAETGPLLDIDADTRPASTSELP